MHRRDLLAASLMSPILLPALAAAQADNRDEKPEVQLPTPSSFKNGPTLVSPPPLEPLSVGSPPAHWDGGAAAKVGQGPCGIAKEFGDSGPIVDGGQVTEYLDDDDDSQASSEWLAALRQEFGGVANQRTEYYELGVAVGEKAIRPTGAKTKFIGYGPRKNKQTQPQWPGPPLVARLGHPMVIRCVNELDDYVSVHMHGAHAPAHSDGYPAFVVPRPIPEDRAKPHGYGQNHRDYFYPHTVPAEMPPGVPPGDRAKHLDITETPSTMWYHDHSMDVTGPHVAFGMAGFCTIYDDLELGLLADSTLPLGCPRGAKYQTSTGVDLDAVFKAARRNPLDIPIALQDRRFSQSAKAGDPENQLLYTVKGHNGFLGSDVLVNGELFPRLPVAPVKYRFRILNGSNARFYKLALYAHFEDPSAPDASLDNLISLRKEMRAPAWFRIGKDSWLYPEALRQDKVLLGMANRADLIVDFAAIREHFNQKAQSDAAFREATKGKRLVIYLANLTDQENGRGPRAKLADGNAQELPPVEPFQNVNVPNDREDSAKGELSRPWLLLKFPVAESLDDLTDEAGNNAFRSLGYTDLAQLPHARISLGTRLRPHRPIRRDEIVRTREVVFERGNGIWQINGKVVDEFVSNFVPELNTAECWILENGGGGWWHPIHIHLESHQQVEYLAEVEPGEAVRLLGKILVRFHQAARDEETIGAPREAAQLRAVLTLLKDSLAALKTELAVTTSGVLDLDRTELVLATNDEPSLQRLTRAAVEKLEEFSARRKETLDGAPRPALEAPLAAFLRLKELYGDLPGMVADLHADSVVESGRLWRRIKIPPWDRYKSDTTILGPNTRVKVFMKFRTFDGPFVFHCHNLEHEDMRMMFTFDPRFTPNAVAAQGAEARHRYHRLEHVVRYRHPFRFSSAGNDIDLRPHIDTGPSEDGTTPAKKMPPWHEVPTLTPKQPRAHPIWGGWDQEL